MSKPAEITDAFLKHVFAQSEKSVLEMAECAYQHGIQDERERIRAEIVEWLDCTGAIPKGTSYYAELLGCTEVAKQDAQPMSAYERQAWSCEARACPGCRGCEPGKYTNQVCSKFEHRKTPTDDDPMYDDCGKCGFTRIEHTHEDGTK